MASSEPFCPKISPSTITPGDIVINHQDLSDIWGVVSRVESEHTGPNRVVFLSSGRIAKFSTYWSKWIALSPQAYSTFMSSPKHKRERMWKEVEKANAEDGVAVERNSFPCGHMRLYLLTLHKDAEPEQEDYEYHIVCSMVVAAYTPEFAKDLALSYGKLDDSQSAWEDRRNIIHKTIGVSTGFSMPTIVNVARKDYNG